MPWRQTRRRQAGWSHFQAQCGPEGLPGHTDLSSPAGNARRRVAEVQNRTLDASRPARQGWAHPNQGELDPRLRWEIWVKALESLKFFSLRPLWGSQVAHPSLLVAGTLILMNDVPLAKTHMLTCLEPPDPFACPGVSRACQEREGLQDPPTHTGLSTGLCPTKPHQGPWNIKLDKGDFA